VRRITRSILVERARSSSSSELLLLAKQNRIDLKKTIILLRTQLNYCYTN